MAQPLRVCERKPYCRKEKLASSPQIPRKRPKEKYGQLSISFDSYTGYVWGMDTFIEEMSGRICMHCGMPGELRDREWVHTECDACSAITNTRGRRS